jgi:PadR family transcriptional regulator, regulatory protein PadR
MGHQRLKQISSDVLGVSDGSLYPALHKLEHRGWIRAQ